jgi:hypothetical protein
MSPAGTTSATRRSCRGRSPSWPRGSRTIGCASHSWLTARSGFWDVCQEHFPDGEEIRDYYHCAEHVYETARAQYGEGTLEAQEWAEATLTRLSLNELGAVVGGLLRMKPRTPEADTAIRALSIYLEGRERVGYDELRRRGLPRGSGGVESANKLICHVRLKRSEAWCGSRQTAMRLRIRCALYNGTFERIFSDYMTTNAPAKPSP